MEKIPLCLIGCGGMGHRHILAHKELEDSGIGNIELMAVCDANPKNADLGKREVERLFDRTPLVFTDLDEALAHIETLLKLGDRHLECNVLFQPIPTDNHGSNSNGFGANFVAIKEASSVTGMC